MAPFRGDRILPIVTTLTRRRLSSLAVTLLAAVALAAAAQTRSVQEGKEFERLKRPQAVESGRKIEVLEFFSYACPHCEVFEPILQGWLMTLPTDIQFRRVPVLFQAKWVALAKIFYTLETLGAEGRISPDVFAAIHRQRVDLTQDRVFFEWAASNGLDRKKVEEIYASPAVADKVNRARASAQAYGVDEVPLMIIDGKFATDPHRAGSFGAMPAVLDALIAKARVERAAAKGRSP